MKYIDTEKVVIAVRQRPLLWKRKHDAYKDKDARDNAWREVTNDVLPDYEHFSTAEKEEYGRRVQQRWRTARDTYIKVKYAEDSQASSSRGIKKYAFYDILSFLDGAGGRVTRRHQEANDESPVEESTADPEWNSAPSPSPSAQPSPTKRTKRKKKESKSTAKQLVDTSSELELEKEDLAFFQSLQPTLKRFNNYQKMLFRTKVLQIIMDMESPHTHEVDVASSPGSANTYGSLTGQYDPMSCTVTIKNETGPGDYIESD